MQLCKKLEIKDLHVKTADKEILKGLNLTIQAGEIHALMGPNGSGKSTLASALLGHPNYEITKGDILLDGESILEMEPEERALKGLFLAFQYPSEVPGVSVVNFLRMAVKARLNNDGKEMSVSKFRKELIEKLKLLEMDENFLRRYLNDGFSGGEKKRMEILQMSMLKPGIAILDETDSGLDIDALRKVSTGINSLKGDNFAALIITHYDRILTYIEPQFVHIMKDGKIIKSAGSELAKQLEEKGYALIEN